ncbi:porin [Octadecabacter arcticus]|nr:porin [Octadecabacter arcticus]
MVAFAGAAFADGHSAVSFAGDASLGYNDDISDGFFWDSKIIAGFASTLDNGLTASASFDINIANDDDADVVDFDDYTLSLTSEMGGLYYGVTAYAAESLWQSAGDMAADGFSEADNDIVLRGELTFGSVTAAVSTAIEDHAGTEADDDATQLSVAAVADLGNYTVGLAYQEESGLFGAAPAVAGDYNMNEVLGLFASTTVAGFDLTLAYAEQTVLGGGMSRSSVGLEVGYTMGDITLGAYYVAEDNNTADESYGVSVGYASGPIALAAYFNTDLDSDEFAVQGSYDLGNGLVMTAGSIDGDSTTDNDFAAFIVADYDLGGGASVMASFADANNVGTLTSDDIDTFGGYELKAGTTIELSFAF